MKRLLFVMLILLAACSGRETVQTLPPTPSASVDQNALLLHWVAEGGNTPRGIGRHEVKVWRNGKISWYDAYKDERIPAYGQTATPPPDAFDGWSSATLTSDELSGLTETVDGADYGALAINPQAQRPSASDSQDETLTLGAASGEVKLELWQLERPEQLPLLGQLDLLKQKYVIARHD
ncbi:MAG: hypothetical protein AB7S38_36970 [Vulcanimicrobiota bacterium]